MEFFRASQPYTDKTQRKIAVIDIVDCTAVPPTEVLGDRYIIDDTVGTVNAQWDGASKNDIVEFDGSVWVASTPMEGWITYVDAQDKDARYVDDGTGEWELVPKAQGLTIVKSSGTIDLDLIPHERNVRIFVDADVTTSVSLGAFAEIDRVEIIKVVVGSINSITVNTTINGIASPSWSTGYSKMTIYPVTGVGYISPELVIP